jgi:hypothetical protein
MQAATPPQLATAARSGWPAALDELDFVLHVQYRYHVYTII